MARSQLLSVAVLTLLGWCFMSPGLHVQACTEVILKDRCAGDAVVSGRTLSFPVGLSPIMTWAPQGAPLLLLDVAPNTPSPFGRTIKVDIPFVCAARARAELAALYKDRSDPINSADFIFCVDGLNQQGLSAAVLYQADSKEMAGFAKDSSKKEAINFMNLGAFALARYSTVAQLKQALQEKLQVVWSTQYAAFGKAISNGHADVPTLHLVFHDATGASLVVQWRDGRMEVLDNPLGVFANNPLMQENYKHFEAYRSRMFANPAGVTPSVKMAGAAGAHSGGKKEERLLWDVPGDYSGQSRFTRMALMKEAANSECWGNKSLLFPQLYETTSPAFVPKNAPASNQAMMAVLGILNTVSLPRGMDDVGQRGPSGMPEFTVYTTLRNHGDRVFLYRTANHPMYKAIDLNKVDWAGLKGRMAHTVLVYAEDPWFKDYSNEYKQGMWGTGSKNLITEGSPK